jgi:thiamine monophosphate kinase
MIEWGGAGLLQGQGVTRDTLKVGDPVIITGNPGRDPADHRMRMVTLKRTTDGFGWGGRAGETVE